MVDPKSATVQRSRIMQTILSYSNHKLDSECYLGKTRANLVPKIVPIYRIASLSAPKSLALAATEKGLIAIVPKPDNSSLWAFTELYLSDSSPVDVEAENLVSRKRSTIWTIQGLLPKTRYYAVARYVDTYGRNTDETVEVSRETLKFSTPFEDMQPADTDPGTLAFQTEGGKVKVYNNGIIEAVDGIFSGELTAAYGSVGSFRSVQLTTAPIQLPTGSTYDEIVTEFASSGITVPPLTSGTGPYYDYYGLITYNSVSYEKLDFNQR